MNLTLANIQTPLPDKAFRGVSFQIEVIFGWRNLTCHIIPLGAPLTKSLIREAFKFRILKRFDKINFFHFPNRNIFQLIIFFSSLNAPEHVKVIVGQKKSKKRPREVIVDLSLSDDEGSRARSPPKEWFNNYD